MRLCLLQAFLLTVRFLVSRFVRRLAALYGHPTVVVDCEYSGAGEENPTGEDEKAGGNEEPNQEQPTCFEWVISYITRQMCYIGMSFKQSF